MFFPSAIVMGWWWLAVIGLLILAYYAAYLLAFREHEPRRQRARCWPGSSRPSSGLIALIYGNNMTMMLKPAELVRRYAADGGGVQLNLLDPTLFPRHLHMVLGAIAVSGLAWPWLGVVRRKQDAGVRGVGRAVRRVRLRAATCVNIFAGLWWLAALPRDVLLQFMGGGHAGDRRAARRHPAHDGRRRPHSCWRRRGGGPASMVTPARATLLAGIVMMLLTRDTVRRRRWSWRDSSR